MQLAHLCLQAQHVVQCICSKASAPPTEVETATLGELAAACLLEGTSLSSAELVDAGYSLVKQWVHAVVPEMRNLASPTPPAPQKQKDLLQHGYYDWVLSEMIAVICPQ